jgi:hypothetical protein
MCERKCSSKDKAAGRPNERMIMLRAGRSTQRVLRLRLSPCGPGLASSRRLMDRRSRHVGLGPLNSNDFNCHIYQAAGRDRRQRQDRAECEMQAVIATDCTSVWHRHWNVLR